MRDFAVGTTDLDGSRVVRVAGAVDLETSPEFWRELQRALQRGGCVKVDLRDVDYIDSSGIAVLIQGLKHAGRRSVDYRLLAPSPRVMAVLELAQLPKLFVIEPPGPQP